MSISNRRFALSLILVVIVSVGLSIGGFFVLLDSPQFTERFSVFKETREWQLLYSIIDGPNLNLSTSITTEPFTVQGDSLRIRWKFLYDFDCARLGALNRGWLNIDVYNLNGTLYSSRGASGYYQNLSGDMAIVPGNYYLVIDITQLDSYMVSIWDYY